MHLPILVLAHIATAHRHDLRLTATTGEGSNTSSIAATALQNFAAVVGTHGSDRGVLSRVDLGIPGKLMQRLALILAASTVLGGPLRVVEAKAMPGAMVVAGVRGKEAKDKNGATAALKNPSWVPDEQGELSIEAKPYREALKDKNRATADFMAKEEFSLAGIASWMRGRMGPESVQASWLPVEQDVGIELDSDYKRGTEAFEVERRRKITQRYVAFMDAEYASGREAGVWRGMPAFAKIWEILTERNRVDATVCGYTQGTWDNEIPIDIDDMDWDNIPKQKWVALEHLGYTAELWSEIKGRGTKARDRRVRKAHIADIARDLREAARSGDVELVKEALLNGPGVDIINVKDTKGFTALMHAAMYGHDAVVQALVAVPGVDIIKAKDSRGYTALMKAATRGHGAVVEALLAAPGVDIKAKDVALMGTAINGHASVVQALLAATGVDIIANDDFNFVVQSPRRPHDFNFVVQEHRRSAPGGSGIKAFERRKAKGRKLRVAARSGSMRLVKKALHGGTGVDIINAKDTNGFTALMQAAKYGHCSIVQALLLTPGVDVNAKNILGATPLTVAAYTGHSPVVKALLAKTGVDIGARDYFGFTAEMYAFFKHGARGSVAQAFAEDA